MLTINIGGVTRSADFDTVLPGLTVQLFFKNRPLKSVAPAVSAADGRFSIQLAASGRSNILRMLADLTVKVSDGDATVFSASFDELYKEGDPNNFTILITQKAFEKTRSKPVIQFSGDDNTIKERFNMGESLHVTASGLVPLSLYDIAVTAGGTTLVVVSIRTDARGTIPSAILWPQMGINDLKSRELLTYEEAARAWKGRPVSLTVSKQKKDIYQTTISLAENKKNPLAFASTKEGRPVNAIEGHKDSLFVSFRTDGAAERYRVLLVERQHDWNAGDTFRIASNRRNKPVSIEIERPEPGAITTVRMAGANQLIPGAYDIIVRPLRYGFEDNEALHLLARDIISSRRITGLVIREDFWNAKPVLGGCVNKIPISGRTVSGAPYFQYADTFTVGENVWGGLDPGIVDPGNISKMCALYVIQSKDDTTWNMDNSLTHLPVLGGNAAVQKVMLQPGCMNMNKYLLWSNASIPGEYDIVADFGNNVSDPGTFVPDAQYNTPLDMIDGYFVPGFRVVEDPGVMTQFPHAGNWNYTHTMVDAMGLVGSPIIVDEDDDYFTPGDFIPTNRTVRLTANLFFPADVAGVTDPAQISPAAANYPLIVIVHGNGQDFTAYDFLLEHFAKNGFIAASIDNRYLSGGSLFHGMKALGRTNVLFKHLEVLFTKFGATVQNNIGIMGHSRGGEAVVKAARINQQNGLGHIFNAVISLAPTDQYGSESLTGAWAKPYFVLYGSRDGDIDGFVSTLGYTVPQTGFALYDRSAVPEKTMGFMYGATHNGFITTNSDNPGDPGIVDPAIQKPVSKAYMNAYFRMKLKNEDVWKGMFTGEWKPASVSSTPAKLFMQYQLAGARVVDDFEGAINWQSSTIGGVVSASGTPVNPEEGKMRTIDGHSPHDSKGLKIQWDNTGDAVSFTIPAAQKDVTGFTHVSIRITQKDGSVLNNINLDQNLRIALKDGANNERAVRVAAFYLIPYPDQRPDVIMRKSAMVTVRIPLKSYTIVCAGQVQVNLADITTLTLLFSETLTGEIDIDNVEFTN